MLGIAILCMQHSQAMLERGVCKIAHFFFHYTAVHIYSGSIQFPKELPEGKIMLSEIKRKN